MTRRVHFKMIFTTRLVWKYLLRCKWIHSNTFSIRLYDGKVHIVRLFIFPSPVVFRKSVPNGCVCKTHYSARDTNKTWNQNSLMRQSNKLAIVQEPSFLKCLRVVYHSVDYQSFISRYHSAYVCINHNSMMKMRL